jgi:peptidyl-prolyl cis-trans isomerase C
MRFVREPLCHFLVLGALLFVLHGLTRGRAEPSSDTITVSAAQIRLLQEQWTQQWSRPPTQTELRALIDQYIHDEVLYREAKALGLDRDDTIVRRRLVQKIDFLFADAATLAEPSREGLRAFFAEHADQYREPEKLSFTHVYFSPDRHHGHVRQDAEQVRSALQAKVHVLRAPERGDDFALSYDYTQKTEAEVAREFGETFASKLFTLSPGEWHGPLESGYGLHLVRVHERIAAMPATFDEVHKKVKDDFMTAKRREANELAYQRLHERYKVVVEETSDTSLAAVQQGVAK